MRKLVPHSTLLAPCLALAGCASGRGGGVNRSPVDAGYLDPVVTEAIEGREGRLARATWRNMRPDVIFADFTGLLSKAFAPRMPHRTEN